jgi:3-oxoacyl-[acyl-carrier protein] reductase
MSDKLDSKVAIITGAGDGVGRTMAQLFAQEGARLVLAARRPEMLEESAALAGGESLCIETDITVEAQVVAMVVAALERFGRIDVLINNAAQPGQDLYIWEQTLENWNNTIAVDTTGAMLCMREVIRQSMLERRTGSIVNVSSTAGWTGMIRKTHYTTAKAALRTLTKSVALEVGPYGIRVNCLVPGGIMTDLYINWVKRLAGEQGLEWEELAERNAASNALRRVSTPEEIAAVALFLACDDSSAITGQSITADAGSYLVG